MRKLAILNESGLVTLWKRILKLFDAALPRKLSSQGNLLTTNAEGEVEANPNLLVRTSRTVFLSVSLTEEDTAYRKMNTLYMLMNSTSQADVLRGYERLYYEENGQVYILTRRHFDTLAQERTYLVFGNTLYTGYGTPKMDGQADTGEPAMIFVQGNMLVVCLPDNTARELSVYMREDRLVLLQLPEEESDAVNLNFLKDQVVVIAGDGKQSVCQHAAGGTAGGSGAAALNAGTADGDYSFAGGAGTADGVCSTAIGTGSASGREAFAYGSGTLATGNSACAGGNGTRAVGNYSHAEGTGTVAAGENQQVSGRYNVEDDTLCEIIGNGTGESRSNCRTLDWNGNEWLAGTIETSGIRLREDDKTYLLKVRDGALVVLADE